MGILLFVFRLFLVIKGIYGAPEVNQPRPFFVFGDSLVDNGNNNFLITPARADIFPYSIDSPSKLPTGRFFNGLNIPDIISSVFPCFFYTYMPCFFASFMDVLLLFFCSMFKTPDSIALILCIRM